MDVAGEFVAGGIGGSLGILVGHPFETTKVIQQTGKGKADGILSSLRTVHRHGLIKGFFRGMSFPLSSAALVNAAYFGVYTQTLSILEIDNSVAGIAFAGMIGGIAQFPLATPIEMTKTTMQSQLSNGKGNKGQLVYFKGPIECMSTLLRTGGVKRLFRGGTALAIRDIPTYAVYSTIYEVLLPRFRAWKFGDSGSSLLAGGFSGSITWSLATPADVIKNRMQSDPTGQLYRSFWHCVKETFKEDGLRTFTRGLLIVNIRAFIVNSVTFWSWSYTLRKMRGSENE